MTRQASPALTPHTITPPLRGSRGAKGLPAGEPVGGTGERKSCPCMPPGLHIVGRSHHVL